MSGNEPQFEEMEPVSGTSVVSLVPGGGCKFTLLNNNNSKPYRNLGGLPIQGTDGKFVTRPGVINRSASPTNATTSDEFWLLEILSIKTLIDFRTTWENKTISPVRKFEDNFVQYSIKKEDSPSMRRSPEKERRSRTPEKERRRSNSFEKSTSSSSPVNLRASSNFGTTSMSAVPSSSSTLQPGTNNNINNNTNASTPLSKSTSSVNTLNNNVAMEQQHQQQQQQQQQQQHGFNGASNNYGAPSIVVTQERRPAEKDMEEQRNNFLWRIYNRNLSPDDMVRLRSHSSGVYRKRYCIPLINNKFFLEGVYQTAPNDTKVKCTVSRYLLFNDKIGAFMLMNHLNDLGILEMYKLTLLYTQEELLTILRILKNKDNYPIMYFCSLGKDRTGMVTSLLLSCLGVPRDLIVEDYSKSEGNLVASMEQIKKYFTRVGLSKDEFVRSPREIMAGLLGWVDETYGSIQNYLEVIGFTHEEQQELKNNLIVSQEEYNNILNGSRLTNLQGVQKRHDEYVAASQSSKKSPKIFSSPRFWRRLSFSRESSNA
ncbi:putative protein tyrosine phosphatase [Heterostelium album PN500]|uniref:Uncharacterized protein n=1 Tax=Heterostelium pallidum (strain ATCC 26659 / Pp 5 / PN500) TaxID=670386 RepID=D3BF52_HETP5|nr:putative protein tyrosine phosphatase [Heterostelium album PN500]EFA79766.1 putative protein tyrosine phosphatase [Heterostelium album PN500]|eukprot:XP_020431887.1 putative protein tyrosine phosphatase [Heterostelium album PN500]